MSRSVPCALSVSAAIVSELACSAAVARVTSAVIAAVARVTSAVIASLVWLNLLSQSVILESRFCSAASALDCSLSILFCKVCSAVVARVTSAAIASALACSASSALVCSAVILSCKVCSAACARSRSATTDSLLKRSSTSLAE